VETNANSTAQGGTQGIAIGELKRRLPRVTPFLIKSSVIGTETTTILTKRLLLSGLTGNLKVLVAAGSPNHEASWFPALAGTMQLIPATKYRDQDYPTFLRPVFQDPTATFGTNAPVPQNIPFGWQFESEESDLVYIDVVIDAAQWFNSEKDGEIVVNVTIEYDGSWWDTDTIRQALAKVVLHQCDPDIIGTGGG
jgi:hypothetical protein